MIRKDKKRVIATLEKQIHQHLEVWREVTKKSNSELINEALKYWMTSQGDTW